MTRKQEEVEVNVTIRGVSPMAFDVRSVVQVVEGRRFQPGLYEIIVGRKLQQRMQNANVGDVDAAAEARLEDRRRVRGRGQRVRERDLG